MRQCEAQRRLVKSPPELWTELSSESSLRRRLAQFGEIRITRVDPETTVAWEGDRTSGTVEISAAGWGTKVTLTATATGDERGVGDGRSSHTPPTADASTAPEAPTAREVATAPAPATAAEPPTPEAGAPRERLEPSSRGFFARLFRRPAAEIPGPGPPAPDPSPPTPAPDPGPMPPGPDPGPPLPAPDPAPLPAPPGPAPDPTPPSIRVPSGGPSATLDRERTVAILDEVLDELGTAHHRPFSRG